MKFYCPGCSKQQRIGARIPCPECCGYNNTPPDLAGDGLCHAYAEYAGTNGIPEGGCPQPLLHEGDHGTNGNATPTHD